jgi:hypothetical protein
LPASTLKSTAPVGVPGLLVGDRRTGTVHDIHRCIYGPAPSGRSLPTLARSPGDAGIRGHEHEASPFEDVLDSGYVVPMCS